MSKLKQGSYLDIPLADNPVLFRYRVAKDSIDNVQVFTGEFAQFQMAVCGDASGVSVIDKEDWERYGYEIRTFQSGEVLHKLFDFTEAKLKQKEQRERTIADTTPNTEAELREMLKQQMYQMQKMQLELNKLTGSDTSAALEEEASKAANEKEKEELSVLVDVDDADSEKKPAETVEDDNLKDNTDKVAAVKPQPSKKASK